MLESEASGRFKTIEKLKLMKRNAFKAIRKLIPEEYQIDILPMCFDHFDSERIKTVILEK